MTARGSFRPGPLSSLAPLSVLVLLLAPPAAALHEEAEREHCISLTRIDRTHVVDDRTILFYMKGSDIYLNRLPHRCPGLGSPGRSFMYRTSIGRLCHVDIITVLDDIGFGFMPGASCGLGSFEKIDASRAKRIRSGEESAE